MSKNAYLRTYALRILPNVKEEFAIRGNTVRVVTSAVPLYFEARDGSSAFFIEEGEQVQFSEVIFTQFDIYHLGVTEVSIVLAVGEGAELNSAKVAGSVKITNLSLDNGRIQVAPVAYGASFSTAANLAANVAEVVVAPAANVNGLLVWNAQMVSYNATALARTSLIAKATAPVSTIDGDVLLSPQGVILAAAVFGVTGTLVTPVKVAAGKGLYFIVGVTETFGSRSLLYSLL